MARALNKLSARAAATLAKPGRHSDGGGLYLSISPDGSRRRWTFMFKFEGRQREMGLGSAATISLARAREKAKEVRDQLDRGIDPIGARRASDGAGADGPTFGTVALEYVAAHEAAWRNSKHRAQWTSTLSVQKDEEGAWKPTGYCQALRDMPVAGVDTDDVMAALKPIWLDRHETATRLRGRIEVVLDAAIVRRLHPGPNPARWKGHLEHLLPPRKRLQRGHHPAMPYSDLPAFIRRLHLARGVGAWALEFTILTAARSGEVRGMTWAEVDVDAGVWTVPGERMKAGKPHRVPLSDRALAILKLVAQLRPSGDDDALVFPGQKRGRPLSDMALTAVMRRLVDGEFTVHGFRSSFRDWAGDDTDHPREVIEAALAHVIGNKTEAAYRRSDAFDKRRALMGDWSRYLAGD